MKTLVTIALALAAASPAAAVNLITNGNFEAGSYAGWTTNVESGSIGNVQIEAYDGVSPLSGFAYQANAGGGQFFSITDQTGPGAYSLTQSFTLASATRVTISFDHFANDSTRNPINNGRLYSTGANQNAIVDLLTGSASAFTTAGGDIIAGFYGPGADAGPNPNPWASYSSTLTLAAGTYQIRFAQADNRGFFQQGVDNVLVTAAIPEPATWAMLIGGFGLVGVAARRRRQVLA